VTGRFRRFLRRMFAGQAELEAYDLQTQVQIVGATPVARCASRCPAVVLGTLRTVTLRPRAGVPALEAELYDGSGTVVLIWLGRWRIAGIEPGVSLVARGRITEPEGRRVIFNPLYELRVPADA